MSRTVSIRITGSGAVFAAACILIFPLGWIFAAVMAAAVHELWHIAALKLCRVKILSLEVGVLGAKLETEPMRPVHHLICAAAGPLGSFSLLLLGKWMPLLSLLGFLQGVFNLLPVYPMDGGRILLSIMTLIMPERGAEISLYIEKSIGLILFCLLFFSVWSNFAFLLLICLILRLLERKFSCKDGPLGLQ